MQWNLKLVLFYIPAICVAQLFGLFPYQNLHSKNPSGIKFKWKSFRVVYSAIFLIYMIIAVALNVFKQFRKETIKASTINGLFFYGSSLISSILFHQIDWKHFTIELCKIEKIFISAKYEHPPTSWSLRKKIYLCTAVGFVASLMNHLLYVAAETQKVLYIKIECNWTSQNFFEDYVREHLNHIFKIVPYHHWIGGLKWNFTKLSTKKDLNFDHNSPKSLFNPLGIIAELGNWAISFYWSFPDIFIVIVAVGISHRFQQINKRIDYLKGRIVSNERWNNVRLDYVEVCEFLKLVNSFLGKLIMMSSLNNSYLILVQLLNVLACDDSISFCRPTDFYLFLFTVGNLYLWTEFIMRTQLSL